MKFTAILCFVFLSVAAAAQQGYWQQRADYVMNVDMDVTTNRFKGTQKLTYTNNSPDKLDKVFYHLYFNAFQPGSHMDVRSRELGNVLIGSRPDWDARVKDRISKLNPDEIGYQKIISLKMNGVAQKFILHGTVLEVQLNKPIMPRAKVVFDMEFEAQVPLQIRRSGRDNPTTNVRYSMSQWYPKLAEYDRHGWHPNPYVAREFYGVWGNFDVTINIDKNYKLAGTGVLQNPSAIGWGYDKPGTPLKAVSTAKRSWRFIGENIHDFVWAADPEFKHIVRNEPGLPVIHVVYNEKPGDAKNDSAWNTVADAAVKVFPYLNKRFGKYPYPQYSFIHGGDGGMEYPMATLIVSPSLGTAFHELIHSWYQMILGTNESLYGWMDEGFTSFAEDHAMKFYTGRSSLDGYRDRLKQRPDNENLKTLINMLPEDNSSGYEGYFSLVRSGLEEPMTTHADHFNTNYAYSIASYSKGEVFLAQLGYITGEAVRDSIMIHYFNRWKYKHPDSDDFIKVAEDVSGLQLDWYKEYWVNGTKTINYKIDSLWEEGGVSKIRIARVGRMPMPVDVQLTFRDNSSEMHYVPLDLMYGGKEADIIGKFTTHTPWYWTHPTYTISVNRKLTDLKKVEIDPSKRMADVDRKNNVLEINW